MKKSIKKLSMLLVLVTVLVSCNQSESLQTYYVNNQEKAGFMSVDVPVSVLNLDNTNLTEEQKEAYESVNKLNILGFKITENNTDEYAVELAKVKTILNNPKYEELFRGGNTTDGKIVVKYIGGETYIDELIVFGNTKEKGFGIIRVLGDDMQPAKIMQLGEAMKDMKFESSELKQFTDFFQ
jgi:hypothetical protein